MSLVTLSATYGAGGSVVGPELAQRLGVHFVDRLIPSEVAARLAVPLDSGSCVAGFSAGLLARRSRPWRRSVRPSVRGARHRARRRTGLPRGERAGDLRAGGQRARRHPRPGRSGGAARSPTWPSTCGWTAPARRACGRQCGFRGSTSSRPSGEWGKQTARATPTCAVSTAPTHRPCPLPPPDRLHRGRPHRVRGGDQRSRPRIAPGAPPERPEN